jgi:YD repeat-containing protein
VSFSYEPYFNRRATMVDGVGTTTYTYHPIGTTPPLGAGRLASVDGSLPNDTITYSYDELGRVVSRMINGVGSTVTYDALARVIAETNVLGSFTCLRWCNASAPHRDVSKWSNQ